MLMETDGRNGARLHPARYRARAIRPHSIPVAMPVTPAAEPSSMSELVGRWWWVIVLCTLLGTAAAFAYVRVAGGGFQSVSLVEVQLPTDSNDPLKGADKLDILANTVAGQAATMPVFRLVSKNLQDQGVSIDAQDLQSMNLSNRLTIQPIKGAGVVSITATHNIPTVAQQIADTTASVIVGTAGDRAKTQLNAQRMQLEQRMSALRDQLAGVQLFQRQQTLEQQLRDHRALLLQLQSNYQAELQQQVQLALLKRQTETPPTPPQAQPPQPTAQQQQQLAALADSAAQARASVLNSYAAQQAQARQTLSDLDSQLAAVRQAEASLPDSSGAVADGEDDTQPDVATQIAQLQQQQQTLRDQDQALKQLATHEQDLLKQQDAQRAQQRQLQLQLQQEVARQSQAQQQHRAQQQTVQQQVEAAQLRVSGMQQQLQALNNLPKGPDPARVQQANDELSAARQTLAQLQAQLQGLRQTDGGPTPEEQQTAQLLRAQIQQLDQANADVDQQLKQTQAERTAIQQQAGKDPAAAAQALGNNILALQQQQRNEASAQQDLAKQRSSLQQQEQELLKQEQAQRALVAQLGLQQQQEAQRQAEAGQHDIQAAVAQAPRPVPDTPAPAPLPELDQVAASADVRGHWLEAINDQQHDEEATIADLSGDLDAVRKQIAAQPVQLDAVSAAVSASLYTQQLAQLTQDYTKLQMGELSITAPVVPFGPASDPQPASGGAKTIMMGIGGGLGLGAALAYLLEVARRQRAASRVPVPEPSAPSEPADRSLSSPRRRPGVHGSNGQLPEPSVEAGAPSEPAGRSLRRPGVRGSNGQLPAPSVEAGDLPDMSL